MEAVDHMGDAEGSGFRSVKEYSMLVFSDLGDVEGFQDPGNCGSVGCNSPKRDSTPELQSYKQESVWDIKLLLRRLYDILRPDGSLSHL